MITHRPAEKRDLETIMQLIARARAFIASQGIDQWQDGYPERELIENDMETGIGVVFLDNEAICGYIALMDEPEPVYDELDGKWLSGAPYATVHRMAIDDGWRGRGVSTAMLSYAEEYARMRGLSSVRADTHRGNKAMGGLLRKSGYTYCGDVRYEVSAGDPVRVAYEKIIK